MSDYIEIMAIVEGKTEQIFIEAYLPRTLGIEISAYMRPKFPNRGKKVVM
jgi:hypothetical protein